MPRSNGKRPNGDLFKRPKYMSAIGTDKALYVDAMDGKRIIQVTLAGLADVSHAAAAKVGVQFTPIAEAEPMPDPLPPSPHAPGTPVLDDLIAGFLAFAELPPGATLADLVALARAWFFGLFVRVFLGVRPLLVLSGGPGSTKTTGAKSLGRLAFGNGFQVSVVRAGDLATVLAGGPLVILDNFETVSHVDCDILAAVSTGAEILQRRLYTDDGQVRTIPDVFVGITAVSAHGIRSDVLDRALSVRFNALPGSPRISDQVSRERVRKARPTVLSEVMHALPEFLRLFGAGILPNTTDRLVDFLTVGLAVSEAVGGPGERRRFERGFAAVRSIRFDLMEQGDAEIAALQTILTAGGTITDSSVGWARRVAEALGAVPSARPSMGREELSAGKWFSALKRRSEGLVVWRLLPRSHGTPREYEATLAP